MYTSIARCKFFLDVLGIFDLSCDNNLNIQPQYCQSWVKIPAASFMAAILLDERLWSRIGQKSQWSFCGGGGKVLYKGQK